MTLDDDTRAVLGYGDQWEQLALRWPLYLVVSTRKDWRKGRTTTQRPVTSALTTVQRREATRRARIGHAPAIIARSIGATVPAVRSYLAARRAA